jgi:hypothetical protein
MASYVTDLLDLPQRYSYNIVESGIKHQNHNPCNFCSKQDFIFIRKDLLDIKIDKNHKQWKHMF